MSLRNEIKSYVAKSGNTMTDVVKMMNEKFGTNHSVQNILSNETLKYIEAQQIAEVIGYTIEWTSLADLIFRKHQESFAEIINGMNELTNRINNLEESPIITEKSNENFKVKLNRPTKTTE